MVVIHFTAMRSCAAALDRLCDPAVEVSAHYLISDHGAVHALVPEPLRAWHAGAGSWGGVTDVNSRSIGIELDNDGASPFTEPLMHALEVLLCDILRRHAIPPHRVIGHSDMAPGRKIDPGPRFDWRRLARQGLSVWPVPGKPEEDFRASARAFGYPDVEDATLLSAFRLRFRPWARGPLDSVDAALAADLARRFPVDAAAASA